MNDQQANPEVQGNKANLLLRLRCACGHLQAVANMIETDKPCDQTLHQLHAVQSALSKVSQLLIQQEANQWLSVFEAQSNTAEASTRLRQLIKECQQIL